jgi:hypothetical protein
MKRLRQGHADVGSLEPNVLKEVIVEFREHDDLPTDAGGTDQTVKSWDEGCHVSFFSLY